MKNRGVLVLAFILVWFVASWQWYTCSIKGQCAITSPLSTKCVPYLNGFIHQGEDNDRADVLKLERFLNVHEDAGLAEDGIYGAWDVRAVEAFQMKHREEILTPWGHTAPTGFVFTTTRDAINRIMCAEQQLITNASQPMFTQPVSTAYDLSDATLEILLMLFGAFILGWLFRHIFGNDVLTRAKNLLPTVSTQRTPMVIHAPYQLDDLKAVEGIGPKIEALLKAHGIKTWTDLAAATPAQIREILARGGERFALANPESWPDQAALARDGRWDDFKNFQSVLNAGRMS